jgi:hypothetical protein
VTKVTSRDKRDKQSLHIIIIVAFFPIPQITLTALHSAVPFSTVAETQAEKSCVL